MKLLNDLMAQYNDEEFWGKVKFREVFPSLAYLKTDYGQKELRKKYNEFTFDIPPPKEYYLEDKIGEDKEYIKKPKTIKDFLTHG